MTSRHKHGGGSFRELREHLGLFGTAPAKSAKRKRARARDRDEAADRPSWKTVGILHVPADKDED